MNKQESWEEEFDRKSLDYLPYLPDLDKKLSGYVNKGFAKSFISSLLEAQKSRIEEKIGGMKKELPTIPCGVCPNCQNEWTCGDIVRLQTYNLALSDALQVIKEM